MALFPIKKCVVCGEEFELKPDKPGFANRCPECSEPDAAEAAGAHSKDAPRDQLDRRNESERDAERRRVIRDMLYRKES